MNGWTVSQDITVQDPVSPRASNLTKRRGEGCLGLWEQRNLASPNCGLGGGTVVTCEGHSVPFQTTSLNRYAMAPAIELEISCLKRVMK
jgi:hypothetical protein